MHTLIFCISLATVCLGCFLLGCKFEKRFSKRQPPKIIYTKKEVFAMVGQLLTTTVFHVPSYQVVTRAATMLNEIANSID
jgi:hypothetical protein